MTLEKLHKVSKSLWNRNGRMVPLPNLWPKLVSRTNEMMHIKCARNDSHMFVLVKKIQPPYIGFIWYF